MDEVIDVGEIWTSSLNVTYCGQIRYSTANGAFQDCAMVPNQCNVA